MWLLCVCLCFSNYVVFPRARWSLIRQWQQDPGALVVVWRCSDTSRVWKLYVNNADQAYFYEKKKYSSHSCCKLTIRKSKRRACNPCSQITNVHVMCPHRIVFISQMSDLCQEDVTRFPREQAHMQKSCSWVGAQILGQEWTLHKHREQNFAGLNSQGKEGSGRKWDSLE